MHTYSVRQVLDQEALARVRELIARSRFEEGVRSAQGAAQDVKANQQLRCSAQDSTGLAELVFGALRRHGEFNRRALPVELSHPMINRYGTGMSYGAHFDRCFMPSPDGRQIRADLSATLFVSAPGDYDGGELCVTQGAQQQSVKLEPGDLFLYPSCTLHSVSTVTRGERLAIVFWVQSMIRDHEKRALVSDLDSVVGGLAQRMPAANEVRDLSAIVNSLTRMWAELA